MADLARTLGALALVMGLSACGAVTRETAAPQPPPGQTAPAPSTPVQMATAEPSNPDSAVLADFNARLDKYVKFQRGVAKDSPKLKETKNPSEISAAQEVLAAKIRGLRKDAKQGDIFTPQVAALFKRLMYPELKGPDRKETKQSLEEEDGETAQVQLRVNDSWPQTEVLPTAPANILENLPQLPEDVEYRISNKRHLVLRDVDANIIVDYIFNAIR